MPECKAKSDTPVIRVLTRHRLFLAMAEKSGKSVSLLTRVRSFRSAVPSYLPIVSYSGSLSAHIPADASEDPRTYSVGYAGLCTPFRLRPILTNGLCGPAD